MVEPSVGRSKWSDVRQDTYAERVAIGFDNVRPSWRDAPAEFTDDTLRIKGHPVMERWETDYMNVLADIATHHGGTVLEVGYGMGLSADAIQRHSISEHIIIEANYDVLCKGQRNLQTSPILTRFLHGFWEECIHNIPDNSIDGILFDTYPLTEDMVHENHFPFFAHAYRILKPGGILTYYSDEIDDFSARHRSALSLAGFSSIEKAICPVSPPSDCQYWKSQTIVAPIVTK